MKGANQFEGPDRFSAVCMFFFVETLFGRPDSPAWRHDYTSESETRACTHTRARCRATSNSDFKLANGTITRYGNSPDVAALTCPWRHHLRWTVWNTCNECFGRLKVEILMYRWYWRSPLHHVCINRSQPSNKSKLVINNVTTYRGGEHDLYYKHGLKKGEIMWIWWKKKWKSKTSFCL